MTLRNSLRNRLQEQNWLDAISRLKNKYEVRSDIMRYIRRDLQDLALLASKVPEDMLEETFTPNNVNELVAAILNTTVTRKQIVELVNKVTDMRTPIKEIENKLNDSTLKLSLVERDKLEKKLKELDEEIPWRDVDDELRRLIRSVDERRTMIAKILIDHGIRYLVDQYSNVEEQLPIRNKIIESMLETQELANSIVNKVIVGFCRIQSSKS